MTQSTITQTTTHGHACFFYDNDSERTEVLAQYFQDGLDNHELCIFVTPDTQAEAVAKFFAVGFDAQAAIDKDELRVFEMNTTYMPDGEFAANYMLHNVNSFLEDAKAQGYHGLRTAGEMSWLHKNGKFTEEAVDYERQVNTVGDPGDHFMGLCLYPMQQTFSGLLDRVLRTHPSYIYDGHVRTSPYYGLG